MQERVILRAPDPASIGLSPVKLLRLLWLGAVGVVAVASLLPDTSAPIRALGYLHISDKLEHLGAYAALSFLPALHERRRVYLRIAALMILMGIGLEFGQLFAEGRQFEVADMVADAGGVMLGIPLALLLRAWVQRRFPTLLPSRAI